MDKSGTSSKLHDPSNPLKFLEKTLEFAALESNMFKSESVVKDVNSLVGAVKEKFEAEEIRKKKEAIEGNGKAEVNRAFFAGFR
ncbi:hypothetical protein LguiA_014408 [Lonicera macranthoides]